MFKLQLFAMVPRLVQTVVHALDQTIVIVDQDLLVQGVQVCIQSTGTSQESERPHICVLEVSISLLFLRHLYSILELFLQYVFSSPLIIILIIVPSVYCVI